MLIHITDDRGSTFITYVPDALVAKHQAGKHNQETHAGESGSATSGIQKVTKVANTAFSGLVGGVAGGLAGFAAGGAVGGVAGGKNPRKISEGVDRGRKIGAAAGAVGGAVAAGTAAWRARSTINDEQASPQEDGKKLIFSEGEGFARSQIEQSVYHALSDGLPSSDKKRLSDTSRALESKMTVDELKDTVKYLKDGKIGDNLKKFSVDGHSAESLEKGGMKPTGVITTLGWLLKSPAEAKLALAQGYDSAKGFSNTDGSSNVDGKKLAGRRAGSNDVIDNDANIGVLSGVGRGWQVSGAIGKACGLTAWLGMRSLSPGEKDKVRKVVTDKGGKWTLEHEDILSTRSNPADLADGKGLPKGYSVERANASYKKMRDDAALAALQAAQYSSTVAHKSMSGFGTSPVTARVAAKRQSFGSGKSSKLMGLAKQKNPIASRLAMKVR